MMSFQAGLLEIPQPGTTHLPPASTCQLLSPATSDYKFSQGLFLNRHFFFFFKFLEMLSAVKKKTRCKERWYIGILKISWNGCFWILRGSGVSLSNPLPLWRCGGLCWCSRVSGLFHSQRLKPASFLSLFSILLPREASLALVLFHALPPRPVGAALSCDRGCCGGLQASTSPPLRRRCPLCQTGARPRGPAFGILFWNPWVRAQMLHCKAEKRAASESADGAPIWGASLPVSSNLAI